MVVFLVFVGGDLVFVAVVGAVLDVVDSRSIKQRRKKLAKK